MSWFKVAVTIIIALLGYWGTQLDAQVNRQRDELAAQKISAAIVATNYLYIKEELEKVNGRLAAIESLLRNTQQQQGEMSDFSPRNRTNPWTGRDQQ